MIPTFETGRLAGLGLRRERRRTPPPRRGTRTRTRRSRTNYPIYYRWYFRTGSHGDFEYLVRLLKPQPVDTRVGTSRHRRTGPGIEYSRHHATRRSAASCGWAERCRFPMPISTTASWQNAETLRELGPALSATRSRRAGRLRQPARRLRRADAGGPPTRQPVWAEAVDRRPRPADHGAALRPLARADPAAADRARRHARRPIRTNWVHRLNLDPRFRVPAAFGAEVVETERRRVHERRVGADRRRAGGQRAASAGCNSRPQSSWRWHDRAPHAAGAAQPRARLQPDRPGRVACVMASSAPRSRLHAARRSLRPAVYTSTAMRRVLRPGARLMRSRCPSTRRDHADNLLPRVNAGEVSAAPPKVVAAGRRDS